jgi:hypothetical protein
MFAGARLATGLRVCMWSACVAAIGCSGIRPGRPRAQAQDVAACARTEDGVWCSRWDRDGFAPATRWSADFGYAQTDAGTRDILRTPDLDEDGVSDICLRTTSGVACALRIRRDAFGPALRSIAFSDLDGFAEWSAASTLTFADVDGDGHLDACARRARELSCAHGHGDGRFDEARSWLVADFGDGEDPLRHATTRFGDVNGDGLVDVCVNGSEGVRCALSLGDHFAAPSLWTQAFAHDERSTDDEGFELVDIDQVAGIDICGLEDNEVHCATSNGGRFDGAVRVATNGEQAVRFADVDGDLRADICLFDGAGSRCSTSRTGFSAAVRWDSIAANLADSDGGTTVELVDVDGDGRADRCDVAASGLSCALSDGARFRPLTAPPTLVTGTAQGDDVGLVTMAVGQRVQPTHSRVNRIVLENRRAGTEDWWIPYPQWSISHEVEAYTDQLSYAPGETANVMLSTSNNGDAVRWMVLRTGWYGGRGARAILDGKVIAGPQPMPAVVDARKPVRAQWAPTFTFTIPTGAVSGVYVLRLDSTATGKSSFVTFVVRQEKRGADLLFDRADFTDEAYNDWDGATNQSSAYHNAFWVSFDRPLRSVAALGVFSYSSGYFVYEYPMVRWLEKQGYDVAYVSDIDVHEHFNLMKARVFLSVGHNEYWSPAMRDDVEGARDAGLNLAFFGSDAVDGVIRFAQGDKRSFSTTISDQTWRKNESANKSLNLKRPPHDNPSDSLTGSHYWSWCKAIHPECANDPTAKLRIADDFAIAAPTHPIFRGVNTSVPLRQVVGYEYETPYIRADKLPFQLQLLGSTVGLRLGEQSVMLAYRAASGALVINLGTMHWAHALDDWTGRAAIRVTGGERACASGESDCFSRHDLAAAQITLNILTDLGAAPTTPSPSLEQTTSHSWP